MKIINLIIVSCALMIGCKVETVAPPQYPQNSSPQVTKSEPSPTFSQCVSSGWDKSKELASEAYDAAVTAAMKAYNDYKQNHPDDKTSASSEP